jgi:hypothetical protein
VHDIKSSKAWEDDGRKRVRKLTYGCVENGPEILQRWEVNGVSEGKSSYECVNDVFSEMVWVAQRQQTGGSLQPRGIVVPVFDLDLDFADV